MIDKQQLIQVINEALQGTDLFLVEATVGADNVVAVTIDSMGSVSLDQCMALDRAIHAAISSDREDYELTVGSYGISEPFKVLRHYQKNVGGKVEVLTADGRKLKGTLKQADAQGFTLTIQEKQKLEGKKRPVMVDVDHQLAYSEVKYTKNIIEL